MRGRTKLVSLVTVITILLTSSMVFASGVIDASKVSLFGMPVDEPNAGTANIFVTPMNTVDSTKQSGSTITVHIDISGTGFDLFSWQINLTYNKNILNVNRLTAGSFLGATKDTSSEVLGHVINVTDNIGGSALFAETILYDVPGVSGSGRLVSIEFLVVGYGSTDIIISLSGSFKTTLLDSLGAEITPSVTNGYFRNKYPGDWNGDKSVSSLDFSKLAGIYGKSYPDPLYDRECDFILDGTIGSADFSALAGNYGKTFP